MKKHLFPLLLMLSISSYAQDKSNYVLYNKLIELKGTDYVIATIENWGKLASKGRYLLFINTSNGQTKELDLPKDAYIDKVEQVKIDSLKINKVIVAANTVNLDGSKHIDWGDPQQIIVVSTDGREVTQVTDDKFYVSTWTVNNQTGKIVVTGHYDSNNNGKYDKTDKHEILIYDLQTLKLISKI